MEPEATSPKARRTLPILGITLVLAAALVLPQVLGAGNGANKTVASESEVEILSAPLISGASSEVVQILTTTIKTSTPADVNIQLTLECALWTNIATVGNDVSEAVAAVKIWVTVDGVVVGIGGESPLGVDYGKIVFCNRQWRQEVINLDDEDAELRQFMATRSANAFNWVVQDLGSFPSPHVVKVYAQLDAQVTGDGFAQAGVGKRSLVVEPVKMA